MNKVPRTFCITLRETPRRKEEAIKYFNGAGLTAEFFDGIHGPSFGLRTTIPNYDILPGREYFIPSGAVGCILSHLMLWNVLIHQPEDEFLIVEDDIQLCEDFFDKFAKFKAELPPEWEMAYVGWLPPGHNKNVVCISENVVVLSPICTHAYLVKKSALKILIDTNQLAWNPLDMQIVSRSLPKLKHYAAKVPLITQRSVFNVKDETWYSLCYDWNINPELLSTSKSNAVRMGDGWHPLEKNADGYMIWSDGRGEFIFDGKWSKMQFDYIAEGEIEKKLRVVCPQYPDQIFDISYGLRSISFPINGSNSVVIVSDTFRPIDIYKTPDCRRLGIRLLKGITLTDMDGKSMFVGLHSMYGAKKDNGSSKVNGTKLLNVKYSHDDGKINIRGQISYNHHRSGWEYVLNMLSEYHRDDATVFDTWLERSFAWQKNQNFQLRLIPYREPWIGVFHNPPNIPSWFADNATPYAMIQSKEFQESLPTCKGIYVLSDYHGDFLKCFLKTVPIETLYLPTEIPALKFSFSEFIANKNKKVVNIGWWSRKLSSIYQLESDPNIYQKIRLLPATISAPFNVVELVTNIETSFRKSELGDSVLHSVIDVRHMSNDEYDELLSKNIVFLDLYDVSANNVIVECMARGTPILINPLPAVIEYLGEDYPFYFTTMGEAAKKLQDQSLIKDTSDYLTTSGVVEKVTGEFFLKTLKNGEIWKSLS